MDWLEIIKKSIVIGGISATKILNKFVLNLILVIVANYLFFQLLLLALFIQKTSN